MRMYMYTVDFLDDHIWLSQLDIGKFVEKSAYFHWDIVRFCRDALPSHNRQCWLYTQIE